MQRQALVKRKAQCAGFLGGRSIRFVFRLMRVTVLVNLLMCMLVLVMMRVNSHHRPKQTGSD